MIISSKKNQQGATLIVVLLLLVVMIVLALSLSSNTSTHAIIANKSVMKTQAFQAAESGSDIVLNYIINGGPQSVEDLKGKTCDFPFTEQYTASLKNIIETSSDSTDRKIKSAWFACYPKNQVESPCGQGTCFAVIIAGVSCPSDGSDSKTLTITDACVVSRFLQGFQISNL